MDTQSTESLSSTVAKEIADNDKNDEENQTPKAGSARSIVFHKSTFTMIAMVYAPKFFMNLIYRVRFICKFMQDVQNRHNLFIDYPFIKRSLHKTNE